MSQTWLCLDSWRPPGFCIPAYAAELICLRLLKRHQAKANTAERTMVETSDPVCQLYTPIDMSRSWFLLNENVPVKHSIDVPSVWSALISWAAFGIKANSSKPTGLNGVCKNKHCTIVTTFSCLWCMCVWGCVVCVCGCVVVWLCGCVVFVCKCA